MSNKIGRITKLARETKDAKFYEVETLTTDLLTVVDTLTCAAISTTPATGDLVVLVEVQGKLFITGGAVDKNTLGQVTSVADDGQLTVALYEDGSTNVLTATTHDRKALTQSVTAFQEAYGAAALKVNAWVKCYQLDGVWYVNNLDWTTAASEDLGAGEPVDFFIDNMDASPNDLDPISAHWDDISVFVLLNGGLTRAGGSSIISGLTDGVSYALATIPAAKVYVAAKMQYTRSLASGDMTISANIRRAFGNSQYVAALHYQSTIMVGISTPSGSTIYIAASEFFNPDTGVSAVAAGEAVVAVYVDSTEEPGTVAYHALERHDIGVWGDATSMPIAITILDGHVTVVFGEVTFYLGQHLALRVAGSRGVGLCAVSTLPDASGPAVADTAAITEVKAWVTAKGEPSTDQMGHGFKDGNTLTWEDVYHDENGGYLL